MLAHSLTRVIVKTGMRARNLSSNWCSSLHQVTIDFDCLHFCWCVVCIFNCLHLCWCVRGSSPELWVLLTRCCWILWIVLLNFNRPTRIWPALLKATETVLSTSLHELINECMQLINECIRLQLLRVLVWFWFIFGDSVRTLKSSNHFYPQVGAQTRHCDWTMWLLACDLLHTLSESRHLWPKLK